MITLSSTLSEELKVRHKEIRFTVEIAGYVNPQGKAIVYSSGPVAIANSDVRPLLKPIGENSSTVDLNGARATFSGVGFTILDKDSEITSRLDDFQFRNKVVTIKFGTAKTAFSDFMVLFTGLIQDFSLGQNGIDFVFRTVDLQENLNQFVFRLAETTLSANITASATTIPLVDDSGLAAAGPFTGLEPGVVARGHVIVGQGDTAEIIRWETKSGGSLTFVTRGVLGTTGISHKVDDVVRELVVWPGHPLEILSVMLSGSVLEEPSSHADVPASWKVLDALAIDTVSWILAKDRTRGFLYEYRTIKEQFARNFSEMEILIPLHLFLIPTETNTLGIVAMIERPIPLDLATKLDRDTVDPEFTWSAELSRMVNSVRVSFDFNVLTGNFVSSTTTDGDTVATLGRIRPRTFNLKGLRTELGGADVAELIAREHFLIFEGVKPKVGAGSFLKNIFLQVGDAVRMNLKRLPKVVEGVRGSPDHFLKILEQRASLNNNRLSFEFFDADIPSLNKYRSVAEDGTPDFDSATSSEQAERLFVGQGHLPA